MKLNKISEIVMMTLVSLAFMAGVGMMFIATLYAKTEADYLEAGMVITISLVIVLTPCFYFMVRDFILAKLAKQAY